MRCYALYQFFDAEVAMTDSLKVALAQLNPKVGDASTATSPRFAPRARRRGLEMP